MRSKEREKIKSEGGNCSGSGRETERRGEGSGGGNALQRHIERNSTRNDAKRLASQFHCTTIYGNFPYFFPSQNKLGEENIRERKDRKRRKRTRRTRSG